MSSPAMLTLLGARTPAGAEADPPPAVAWSHAWWASDLALADGADVSSWAAQVGGATLTTVSTTAPTFQATGLNGLPVVRSVGTSLMRTGLLTEDAAPRSLVAVIKLNSTAATATIVSGYDGSSSSGFVFLTPSTLRAVAGSNSMTYTSYDTNPHLVAAYFTSSSLTRHLDVDGTQQSTGQSGADPFKGVTLFGSQASVDPNVSSGASVDIAFLGVFDGDVFADSEWSNFEQWVEDTYGITVA